MIKYIYNYISILEQDYKLSDGTITRSQFPPQQSFQIEKDDKIMHFTAFADIFENDTALVTTKYINTIITQLVIIVEKWIIHYTDVGKGQT